MFEQHMGIYGAVWFCLAILSVWLLFRIYEVLKAIHFMLQKDFDEKWIKPLDREADWLAGE